MKLTLCAAVACSVLVPTGALAQTLTNAPAAVRPAPEPFTETVFGDRVSDPYRWMENPARIEDVRTFIRQSSDHTVAQLAALPGRAPLRARLDAASQAGTGFRNVQQIGTRTFYRRSDPGAQFPKLVMREARGPERVLYDPNAAGAHGALNSYSVSPDGRTVAFHTAAGGAEIGAINFIDVASGRELPDRATPVWGEFRASWLDGQTYAYTQMQTGGSEADQLQNMRVVLRRVGGQDGAVLLGAGAVGAPAFQPQEFPVVWTPTGSDWVIGIATGARADKRVFIARRAGVVAGRPEWREVAGYADQVNDANLRGDRLYLVTNKDAPNGRVAMIDLAHGQTLAQATDLLANDPNLIKQEAIPTAHGLYILAQTDGVSRLFLLADGSRQPVELRLPMRGNLSDFDVVEGGDGVTFLLQDWFTAPRAYAAVGERVSPLGLDSTSYPGVRGARQVRELARSAGGTSVPMDILLPARFRRGTPLPLLLEGYGSYGANVAEPYYAINMFGLVESGGAVAFCGTRGGGERGRAWHEAGRAANKVNAYADLIACGERLVQLGYTTNRQMTVLGTSAGGILSPNTALRRPDLFAGLIANVGMVNATRLAAAENGANQYAEFGDPREGAGYRSLLVQDAYRTLGAARDIPDTMLTVGLNDHRVAPWMSAKFAALAMTRFGDRHLVLLRTDPNAGHGVASARDSMVDLWTDIGAFVMNRAGAPGFTGPAAH